MKVFSSMAHTRHRTAVGFPHDGKLGFGTTFELQQLLSPRRSISRCSICNPAFFDIRFDLKSVRKTNRNRQNGSDECDGATEKVFPKSILTCFFVINLVLPLQCEPGKPHEKKRSIGCYAQKRQVKQSNNMWAGGKLAEKRVDGSVAGAGPIRDPLLPTCHFSVRDRNSSKCTMREHILPFDPHLPLHRCPRSRPPRARRRRR